MAAMKLRAGLCYLAWALLTAAVAAQTCKELGTSCCGCGARCPDCFPKLQCKRDRAARCEKKKNNGDCSESRPCKSCQTVALCFSPTTKKPTKKPTKPPTKKPTKPPTKKPTKPPTKKPTKPPTRKRTTFPTKTPTKRPNNPPILKPSGPLQCQCTESCPPCFPTKECREKRRSFCETKQKREGGCKNCKVCLPTPICTKKPTQPPTKPPIFLPSGPIQCQCTETCPRCFPTKECREKRKTFCEAKQKREGGCKDCRVCLPAPICMTKNPTNKPAVPPQCRCTQECPPCFPTKECRETRKTLCAIKREREGVCKDCNICSLTPRCTRAPSSLSSAQPTGSPEEVDTPTSIRTRFPTRRRTRKPSKWPTPRPTRIPTSAPTDTIIDTTAEAVTTVVVASAAVVTTATTGMYAASAAASAAAQSASTAASGVSGAMQMDFDPSSIVHFAQFAVMSAQMNLPNVPDEYYNWASSFSWASLNFGFIVPKSNADVSTRRLQEDTAGFSYGFAKYCDVLGIEQQYLFIDILGGYIVLGAISVWLIILYWAMLMCMKPCIGQEKLIRMWNKIDVVSLFVSASYYGFYPFVMGIFFQMSFHVSLESDDKRLKTARILSAVAVACLIFEIIWFSSVTVVALKREKKKPRGSLSIVAKLGLFHKFVDGKVDRLTKYWRPGFTLWWVFKLLRWMLTSLIITTIFAPKPFQPILILVVSAGYTGMLLYYKPYKYPFQNKIRLAYAFLGITNACIFIVYGMSSSVERFGAETVSKLGKAQLLLNVLMLLVLMLCHVTYSMKVRSFGDFFKCITCRCKYISSKDEGNRKSVQMSSTKWTKYSNPLHKDNGNDESDVEQLGDAKAELQRELSNI